MESGIQLDSARAEYILAHRYWTCNNLKSCLSLCDHLSRTLGKYDLGSVDATVQAQELNQLKHLVWFLKVKCLAEDYYLNESLLLNEDDIEDDQQVRCLRSVRGSDKDRRDGGAQFGRTGKLLAGGASSGSALGCGSRRQTGILTGRLATVRSGQTSGATSAYRPLTTRLSATQTAFSRSTRPLLRYSTCPLLAKHMFEYLYSAQVATNKYPDYRQCLEYINLVQDFTHRQRTSKEGSAKSRLRSQLPTATDDPEMNERTSELGFFWLLYLGICYFKLRMNQQAERYFLLARSVNPKQLDSYTWLVKVYLRTGEPGKVMRICETGLSQGRSSILFNWMSRVQTLLDDPYGANLSLQNALASDPTNLEALANVGYFSFYANNRELALKCFERIRQLSSNQTLISNDSVGADSRAELLNNLALCNFYNGFYHKVVPLFLRAILISPSKEVTSCIWYNMSFVPISCGFRELAIACLKLALANCSQNEEAANNLGVLRYENLVADRVHFSNREELRFRASGCQKLGSEELRNHEDQAERRALFDQLESYFGPLIKEDGELTPDSYSQPEMLYNMAIVKERRGQLMAAANYCSLYLEHDARNYHIRNMLREIQHLVTQDC